jgi:uncharacterized protein
VSVQVTVIMIGVQDLARSKAFYGEGLGCPIDPDGYLWKVASSSQ